LTVEFHAPDERYFIRLADYSRDFVRSMGLTPEPLSLARVLEDVKHAIDERRLREVAAIAALPMTPTARAPQPARATGLNTVGLLADRLTILVVKEWSLRHRSKDSVTADAVLDAEIPAIARALAQAEPDQRHFVGKVSSIKAGAVAATWPEAYYGLLATNLMLWETQEVLYTRDILVLPAEELRAYIRWFSVSNMLRNEFMALCERLMWTPR